MLLYETLQSTLEYDTVLWRTWVTAAGKKLALKTAAKPPKVDVHCKL